MSFRTVIDGIGAITETSPGVFDTTGIIAEDVTSIANDLLAAGGVVGGMVVTQTSPASNQVEVSPGKAWVENDAWTIGGSEQKFFPVNNDNTVAVTIPANASGNPRIDLICVKVDPSIAPGDDGAANCEYIIVQGTPGGAPVAPAVPAKHEAIAQIAVANGFSSITSANITDVRRSLSLKVNNWIELPTGFTRSGNHVITCPAGFDPRLYMNLGAGIRYIDGTGTSYEYGSVVALSSTSITLATNIDYVLAGTPSKLAYTNSPETTVGFPDFFSYTPTISASGSMTVSSSTKVSAIFKISGKQAFVNVRYSGITLAGVANNEVRASLPVTAIGDFYFPSLVSNSGTFRRSGGSIFATFMAFNADNTIPNWTIGANSEIYGSGWYRYAS